MSAPRGLILYAHGARDPRWAAPFAAVAERVRARSPGLEVRLAFLELMAPDLADAGRSLAAAGCERVDVLPLFLGAGGHVRKDIPAGLAALAAAWPAVRWQLHPAIGEDETLIEAMASIALARTMME
jgi:sirohydrochlorin cobaltochelatase